jgi:hypothetical protein
MPGNDSPPRNESNQRAPPEERGGLDDDGRYETRECRVCGASIPDPLPNQYECQECEDLEERLGATNPTIEPDEGDGQIHPDILSEADGLSENDEPGTTSDLQDAIEAAGLPPLDVEPSTNETILSRIDVARNEPKFRTLHINGDWREIYDEDEYDEPYEIAVGGYLRVVAFYTRLSVTHMESFYRASALYDPKFWSGWDRLRLLEEAVESQAGRDPGYRAYGSEASFDERLSQARSRLQLIERQMDR